MSTQILDRFCIAGINYQKADTEIRGLFSVQKEDMDLIAQLAKEQNIRSVFVVSTCNRTEIYGFAESVMLLAELLLKATKGTAAEFLPYAYLKNGVEALDHLYSVASGLDSQILGDYEILGQLKQAVDTAAAHDLLGPIMNRTINFALQASKRVKTHTALSSGTVSVSYAAIELLKAHPGIEKSNILVFGTGKFGGNVTGNLKKYLPNATVTVINRTDVTAAATALRHEVAYLPYSQLETALQAAEVIIVCTNAGQPTLLPQHFTAASDKLILDLSVPMNVHPDVKTTPGILVIDVDEISTRILDKTIAKRKTEVPQALEIIQQHQQDFLIWLSEYKYSLHIKSWKDKLAELSELHPQLCEMAGNVVPTERKIQKAVTTLAVNLRTNQEKGCQFINAINDYLKM